MRPGGLRYVSARCVENEEIREGAQIETAEGEALGCLDGFVVDPVECRLRYLVCETGRGARGSHRLVSFEPAVVDAGGGKLRLLEAGVRPDDLPEFRLGTFPPL